MDGTMDVKEALNEYFKLKQRFEREASIHKLRISNNTTLSKKEKRAEYLKLMPKCIHCKKPSRQGTLFSTTFQPSTDKSESYRTLKAICGNLANPCNLHIEINLGKKESLDVLMKGIRHEIVDSKNEIISDKNKLLFGFISTEEALENFDTNQTFIREFTSMFESYLDQWTKIVDNPEKKTELNESLEQSYNSISTIKKCMKQLNETNNQQFAVDAATTYVNILQPLLLNIRQLKYKENIVSNDDGVFYKLIQSPYTFKDILFSSYDDNVVAFNVGLQPNPPVKKTKPAAEAPTFSINIPQDEPIIQGGGVTWETPQYTAVWDALPSKIKDEFAVNVDWMKAFMEVCVHSKEGCNLTTPPNIVIPPREMSNGNYDFGISIYNKVFNALAKPTQQTYLALYKEDPFTKAKDYEMFESALNALIEKEVGWENRGFI